MTEQPCSYYLLGIDVHGVKGVDEVGDFLQLDSILAAAVPDVVDFRRRIRRRIKHGRTAFSQRTSFEFGGNSLEAEGRQP